MSSSPDVDLCDFLTRLPVEVLTKGSYSAATDSLLQQLHRDGISQICLIGMDTDMCVLHTALDLFSACLRPIVLADLCASTGGEEAHSAGLSVLRRSIGDEQVIDSSSLGEVLSPDPQQDPRFTP